MEVNCERPSPKAFLVLESEEGKRVVARERIKKNSLFGPFPGKEVTSKEKRSANCWEVSRISGCVSRHIHEVILIILLTFRFSSAESCIATSMEVSLQTSRTHLFTFDLLPLPNNKTWKPFRLKAKYTTGSTHSWGLQQSSPYLNSLQRLCRVLRDVKRGRELMVWYSENYGRTADAEAEPIVRKPKTGNASKSLKDKKQLQ